jgi:hypothetical protein
MESSRIEASPDIMPPMNGFDDLQRLVDEVTREAQDEPGRFRSFLAALQAVLRLPADAHVIGEPVELLGLDYSGHSRQGLMARCRREGREYVVSVADITLPSASPAARLLAAYHLWCGLEPVPQASAPRPPKAALEDVPEDQPVELVVLVLKQSAARCRLLGSDCQITLRSTDVWELVPGDITTVQSSKRSGPARRVTSSTPARSWTACSRATCAASQRAGCSRVSRFARCPRRRCAITNRECASGISPCPRTSAACCRGRGPAIGPSSAACTATACASGA